MNHNLEREKSPETEMRTYYKERAPIYDRIYHFPERQSDLSELQKLIPAQFNNRDVIEIAAGTGYWSQHINNQSRSLLATDANREVLDQINQRTLSKAIETRVIDAYNLTEIEEKFTGAFSGLWISHIPKQRLEEFLISLHRRLEPEAAVVFIDNSSIQCELYPIVETDNQGNTYQERALDDGSTYRVLKNFPSKQALINATSKLGSNHRYIQLEHFWYLQYTAC